MQINPFCKLTEYDGITALFGPYVDFALGTVIDSNGIPPTYHSSTGPKFKFNLNSNGIYLCILCR